MANEITHALLQTNGGQAASVLSDMLVQQLFDPTDLRQVCQFVDVDGITGSDTVAVTKDAVPQAAAAASSETSGGASNTAYTTGSFSLTWARYLLKYQMTDLLALNGGPVGMAQVLASLQVSIGLTLTDLIAALFPSLANDVGPGSGVDLDVDSIYDGMFQLNSQNVPGPYYTVYHNVQHNDFVSSLRGETGAVQFQAPTADMLRLTGPGLKGSWNGVTFIQSDSCGTVNSGADRSGAMFGFGCFAWTIRMWRRIAENAMINPADVLADFGLAFVERDRDADNGMTSAYLNLYPAVVEREDLRGVEIISDA